MMQDETSFKKQFSQRLNPTNLPGVYATPAPPDDFDPRTASAASLIKHGVPWRRPQPGAHPALIAAWERVFSRRWLSKDRIVPVMEPVLGKTHQLRHPVVKEENGTYSSFAWGGCALAGPPSSWNGVQGIWVVPTVSEPSEPQGTEGGWDSSSWVGIDGYNTGFSGLQGDIAQAGVEQRVNSAGKASYIAWYEWYVPPPTNLPPGTKVDGNGYPEAWVNTKNGAYQYIYQVNIPSLKVAPGQSVIVSVLYGADSAEIGFANETTGKYFQITLQPPPGANLKGNSVEWIMEMPNGGWPNSSLAKFTPLNFGDAFASTPGCVTAGLPSKGDIINLVSNGKQLTKTSVPGPTYVAIDFSG